jgi:hypothetical protein
VAVGCHHFERLGRKKEESGVVLEMPFLARDSERRTVDQATERREIDGEPLSVRNFWQGGKVGRIQARKLRVERPAANFDPRLLEADVNAVRRERADEVEEDLAVDGRPTFPAARWSRSPSAVRRMLERMGIVVRRSTTP